MSAQKRRNRIALAAMRKLAVVLPLNSETHELRNIRGVRVIGTEAHWHAVDQMQHIWWVAIVVATSDSLHIEILSPELLDEHGNSLGMHQCRHEQLSEKVKARHAKQLEEIGPDNVVATGWCAAITELDEDDVISFMRLQGVIDAIENAA